MFIMGLVFSKAEILGLKKAKAPWPFVTAIVSLLLISACSDPVQSFEDVCVENSGDFAHCSCMSSQLSRTLNSEQLRKVTSVMRDRPASLPDARSEMGSEEYYALISATWACV